MAFIDFGIKNRALIQELQKQAEAKDKEIGRQKKIQMTLVQTITGLEEYATANKGNNYPDYGMAVAAISDKYNGKANWGCLQTGAIIDLRSAFILGEGIKVVPKKGLKKADAAAEMEWAEKFFEYNSLDQEMSQELVKEAEIEGKLALSIVFDDEKVSGVEGGMISARFISWSANKYKVVADPKDYLWYKEMTWTPSSSATASGVGGDTKPQTLKEEDFIYKKFGGRLNTPNEAQPKIQKCLTQIDNLDMALKDLRTINHTFSAQTPNFEVDTAQEVEDLSAAIQGSEGRQNWRMGSLIVHTGRFNMVGPDTAGVSNLILEIELLAKIISGTTGIPIHFLGFLDLLRNRATGDNTRELVNAATTKERSIWKGAFNELIAKAMTKFNEETGASQKTTALDPSKIEVTIPLITQEHWDRIRDVLIPAAAQGILSNEYVASVIPGVDVDDEAARKESADASELERIKGELAKAKLETDVEDEEAIAPAPARRGGGNSN